MALRFKARLRGRGPVAATPFSKRLPLPTDGWRPEPRPPSLNPKLRFEERVIVTPYSIVWDGERVTGSCVLFFHMSGEGDAVPLEPSARVAVYSDEFCEVGLLAYPSYDLFNPDVIAVKLDYGFDERGRWAEAVAYLSEVYVKDERLLELAKGAISDILSTATNAAVEIKHPPLAALRSNAATTILYESVENEIGAAYDLPPGTEVIVVPLLDIDSVERVEGRLYKLVRYSPNAEPARFHVGDRAASVLKAWPAVLRLFKPKGEPHLLVLERLRYDTWEMERLEVQV